MVSRVLPRQDGPGQRGRRWARSVVDRSPGRPTDAGLSREADGLRIRRATLGGLYGLGGAVVGVVQLAKLESLVVGYAQAISALGSMKSNLALVIAFVMIFVFGPASRPDCSVRNGSSGCDLGQAFDLTAHCE